MKCTIDNNRVIERYRLWYHDRLTHPLTIKRLRNCNAKVAEFDNYYVLTSYRTKIALIDKDTNTCYDWLRYIYGYTATSAQHIAKFCDDYGATEIVRYKD